MHIFFLLFYSFFFFFFLGGGGGGEGCNPTPELILQMERYSLLPLLHKDKVCSPGFVNSPKYIFFSNRKKVIFKFHLHKISSSLFDMN